LEIDQLIQLCKKKDEPAQMEVYNRYHLAMYHSALRIVQNRVDDEDVMQESFLTAFEKLEQYKGGNKFGGWLKQITLRKALHFCEQRNKQKTVMYPLLDLEVFMCVAVTNLTLVLPALGVYVPLGNQRIIYTAKLLGQAQ